MFKTEKAIHENIYSDIVNNYKYRDGATFGEMQEEIDGIYRQKIDDYGLKGYFNDDAGSKETADKELSEYFDRKLSGTQNPTFTVTKH